MFDGVHTAVGNFYSFIQGDKGGLPTQDKKTYIMPWTLYALFFLFLMIDIIVLSPSTCREANSTRSSTALA